MYEEKFISLLPFHPKKTCPKKLEEKQRNKAHLGIEHKSSRVSKPNEKGTLGELKGLITSATSRHLINVSICFDD